MNPTKGSITSCLLLYILLDIALTAALTVPKFVQHPESQVIKQNSKAVLHCMVLPETAQIQWTFNGKPLESHDGVEVRRRQLTIQSFRHAWKGSEQSHEGVYQCKAITSVGVILSNEAILERAFLGQFPQGEDQTVSATEGNTALIPCDPPQGSPRPLISFERNGVTMDTSSHRHHVLPSGDLQIAEVRQSDEGEYRCVGENPVSGQRRVSSHTVTLHVRSPTTNSVPRFVEKMERMQTVVQGEDLVLECVVQGSPVPVVMWDKHSGQMPQGRVSLLLGNLVIRDVQVADQGTYICRAENTVGVPATDYVDVDVLEPPSVGIPPADQVAIEGATVVFQCLARGRNVYTQWLYNGQQVDSHTQFSISDTSLTITRVTKENAGIYQCVARSRLGMTSSAALLQVKGQDEVNFTWPEVPDSNKEENNPSNNKPTSKTTASPDMGKSTTDPFPSLRPGDRRHRDKSGRKNGNNPRNGRRPSESNSDNLVPPTTPEIAKLSDTSVHVRWSVPQNDGLEITFFKIQFKDVSARNKEDRKWDTYSMDIPGTTNEYEVRRLKPGATYKFRVLAVYSNMDNRWSQPSRRVTLVDGDVPRFPPTPSSGPIIVKAEPVGPNTISLKWQYNEDDSGEIEGYNIYYKPFNSNGPYSRQEILGGNTVRYVLTGLHPDTYYTIRMKSYNQQGEGPDSNEVVKATNEVTGYTRVSPHNTWPQNNDEWTTSTRRVPSEDFGSSSTGRSNQTLYMVLGIALGLALVILLIIMLLCWRKQKRDRQAQNSQKTDSMRKKEQQMNGGPHHFLLHNMNANSPNGINGSIRNGRFGGSQGGQTNGTNHMSLTVNPYTGTTQAHAGDQNTHQDASERNYSPEDLEIQNLRRSLQELLQQPPAPPLPHQDRNGIPVYYSNTASTVNINTRGQPNYYEVDPAHHDTLPRVHMATFGCPDCSTSRSRPQSRAESSLSNTAPPEYNSLGLRAQPMFSNTRSSTEIPDYSGSLHRQKPITNPYHIYNKDSSNPYRNSPDHIPRSHERPPFRPHDVYSRSLRGPAHELAYNYPPGYDTAVAKYGSVDNNPDIYEQVSDNHSVGSSSGRLRSRRKSPHRGSASNTRNMGFVPVGGQQRMEQHPLQPDRSVNLGHDLYPTSQALPAMHLPQPIKRGDTSTVPPQLPPRNLLQNNSYSTSPFMETENYSSEQQSQNQLDPVHTDPVQSENVDSENRRESPQVIDDLSQDLPVLSGSLEASYGTGETDTAPPSIGHRDLNATTSDNLDSDLEMSDNEGNEEGLHSAESVGLQEELSPLVRPVINTVKTGSGVGSTETTPLMQRNIPRANDYPSDDDNEDC